MSEKFIDLPEALRMPSSFPPSPPSPTSPILLLHLNELKKFHSSIVFSCFYTRNAQVLLFCFLLLHVSSLVPKDDFSSKYMSHWLKSDYSLEGIMYIFRDKSGLIFFFIPSYDAFSRRRMTTVAATY